MWKDLCEIAIRAQCEWQSPRFNVSRCRCGGQRGAFECFQYTIKKPSSVVYMLILPWHNKTVNKIKSICHWRYPSALAVISCDGSFPSQRLIEYDGTHTHTVDVLLLTPDKIVCNKYSEKNQRRGENETKCSNQQKQQHQNKNTNKNAKLKQGLTIFFGGSCKSLERWSFYYTFSSGISVFWRMMHFSYR